MSSAPHSNVPPVTEYFTGLASMYADYRPSYPRQAINWILAGLQPPVHAADVGCGTGISTRLLAEAGAHVIGIDPNADMLDQARRTSAASLAIEYRTGTGERTGLADASVDLVTCAQSFHWFDALAALREFHRIIKPGGRLALMWNWKLKSPTGIQGDPFTAAFTAIMQEAQADAAKRGLHVPQDREADPTRGGYFANPRRQGFENPQWMDLDGMIGRARSASYFPKSGPVLDQLLRKLKALFIQHQHNGRVRLLHFTEVTLADRNDHAG